MAQKRARTGMNLQFFTGLYKKEGKVLFSAILDSDRAREALKEAIKETEVEDKISLVILDATKGDADAWAAFAGVQPPEKKKAGKKKFVKRPAWDDEDEEDEVDDNDDDYQGLGVPATVQEKKKAITKPAAKRDTWDEDADVQVED